MENRNARAGKKMEKTVKAAVKKANNPEELPYKTGQLRDFVV